MNTIKVRVYFEGKLVAEEEVAGRLSASPAKSGKGKGGRKS